VSDVTDERPAPTSVSALTRFLLGVIADPTSLDDVEGDAQEAQQEPQGETS
jgi:hypothetical protein